MIIFVHGIYVLIFVFHLLSTFTLQQYLIWRRQWQPTPLLLPGKSHGQRRLVGYSPWGRKVGHDWATSLKYDWGHIFFFQMIIFGTCFCIRHLIIHKLKNTWWKHFNYVCFSLLSFLFRFHSFVQVLNRT